MREFFDAGVAPARGQILARSRAVARWAQAVWLICLLASLLPSAYAQTTTRGFGNGTNQFTMDFVTIGNPNNVADTTGTPNPVGSVAYTYNLGKYEVSREQIDKANTAGGLGITMFDMSSYGGNGVNKPATGVTWHEAAKFVNWLNTSTGGTAAYKFVSGTLQPWSPTDAGYNASNLFRNSQAKYVIASRDEWYKGAYGSPNGTWYNYPTGSDIRPSAVAGGTDPNTAVYDGQAGPADINNAGGLSAYGTMGQGGNVWEWNETAHDGVYNTVGESLEMRGGSWNIGSDYLDASYRNYYVDPAIDGNNSYGFRVAVVSSTTSPTDFTSTINNGEVTITGYTGTGGVIEIPATIGGLPVTTIGQNAFQSKTSVTSVVIPNGVTTILDAAFAGCSSMTAITLPNSLTSIGGYVFDGCSNLQSITLPEGVISIGPNAFAFCTSLPSITLPSGLNKISSGTFWNCTSLTSIIIPSIVNEIQYNAFLNCSKLASVTFLGNTRPTFGNPTPFGGIAPGAKGYYPATASVAWNGITGLSLEPSVYNRLINGSFEDGIVKPSPGGNLPTHQDNVPGWKTTANNLYTIELWGTGFAPDGSGGSSGGDGNVLAELNYIASGTLYQDVIMTVGTTVSYSFLHRGRSGTETIEFRIDQLVGGPGSEVESNFFNRQVSTGNGAWVRYRGTPAGTVQVGKTYRFSYSSVTPLGGSGNLLDGASFEIDQDADGLTDSVETSTGTYVSANNTGTNPSNPDSDNDGFSDGVEVEAGSSPTSADGTPLPKILTNPVEATKELGQTHRFEVVTSGVGLTYQWKKNGLNVIDASNSYLDLTSLQVSDSGSYMVTVSNSYGSVTSPAVYLSVNQVLISSGFSHTLYLAAGASNVTAWGMNTDGRLGVGDTSSPVNWARVVQGIPAEATVAGLSAGGTHSLILAGGQVYAAGSDRYGQLGQGAVNGVNKASFTPVAMTSNTPVAVAAGGNHSLIVTASGKVFGFGDNTYGQLAQPVATTSLGTLTEVIFPGLTNRIVSVAAGADHNLAVDENGGVWVWGRNNYGQLGKGTRTAAERTPSKLAGVTARSVAAGFSHSLILETSGTVRGFGRNNCGQTGQSATSSMVLVPTLISSLSGIRSIAAGTDSSFTIDQAGQLRSWGYNAYGELLLGYASPISSPAVYVPTPSPIATNVSNVAGGGYSTLAVGAQGVIFGGRNDMGQAGNGPDPEQVVGDYYNDAGNLPISNLTMDLAGTTETLYDQVFIGNGTATLNGILNLMFVGTYTGPVYGSTQTFDLIWAKDGIVFGTGYELAFNQAGYLVESAVADKSVNGVAGKVLQATIRAVVTEADLIKALDLAGPNLDGVQSVSYRGGTNMGMSALSVSSGVEMIYSYKRPTGGVSSGSEYFVEGTTYRVEYGSSLSGPWVSASISGTTVTPLGNGRERVTLRISSSEGAGFLRLQVESPQATGINTGVGNAATD